MIDKSKELYSTNDFLFQALLLRAETCEEYPSGDEAAGHLHGQEFSFEEQSLQATETADEDQANQSLPRFRPQGRDHRRRNHGRIPGMLGTLLLRQHRRSLLQALCISPSVPGATPCIDYIPRRPISSEPHTLFFKSGSFLS